MRRLVDLARGAVLGQHRRVQRDPSKSSPVKLSSEAYAELDAFLAERIYEFNSETTGIFDGEEFAGSVTDSTGAIIAGVSGHTWGGCCELKQLWVHETHRGSGLGTTLMQAVEAEARKRGCTQIVLSTHDFQAPVFYERFGYQRRGVIAESPRGHSSFIYVKQLT